MPTTAFFDSTKLTNGDIQQELNKVLDQAVRETQLKFAATFATWNHKPKMEVDTEQFSRVVGTNDFVYELVSEKGGKAHMVRPKNKKALRFQDNYRAKSQKGVLGSSTGGASGAVRFSKGHMVKGFEAREFVKTIQEQMDVRMEKLTDEALRKLYG